MPLPPLPENNTDRAWLKYTMYGIEHEMCFRLPSATPQATFITVATSIANVMKASMPTADAFTGLRHADSGSNLSFPLAWTNIAGTGGTPSEDQDKAKFMSLVGRSLSGYRCRITFFAQAISDNIGFRVNPGVDTGCTNFYNTITALDPALVAVDGGEVVWNGYINVGYNSYWQRQLRST